MRLRLTICFVAAILVAFLAYEGLLAYRAFAQQQAVTFFSSALAAQHISTTVEVDGTRYEVNGGIVGSENGDAVATTSNYASLRMAYAQTLAERSPIAAIPGTNPDTLDQATNVLASIEQDLANTQQDQQDKSAVQTSLYPISFLHALAATERARLLFIESGSDTDEAAYGSAQLSLLRTYRQDLSNYESTFQNIVPSNAADYEVFEGTISRASILASINDLQNGIEQTQTALNARDACISGHISSCNASELELPVVANVASSTTSTASTPPYLQDIRAAYADATGNPAYAQGNVIQLNTSACLQALNTDPLFVLVNRRRADDSTFGPEFVGDIEFVPTAQYANVPYYQYFSDQGIAYSYFPVWEPYKCPELASDTSRIVSVQAVSKLAANEPFSADVTDPAMAQKLRTLEQALAQPKNGIDTESDALTYLAAARTALLQQSDVSTSTLERLSTATLATEDNSERFDLFLGQITDDEAINLGLMKNNVPVELGAEYLFYVQSGFFGLFMGADPSLVGVQPPPIDSNASTSTLPFVPYSVLRKTVPNSELVHDMTFFFTIHKKASGAVPID